MKSITTTEKCVNIEGFALRTEKLRKILKLEGIAGILLSQREFIKYFSGQDALWLLVLPEEEVQVGSSGRELSSALDKMSADCRSRGMGIDGASFTVSHALRMAAIPCVPVNDILLELISVKEPWEQTVLVKNLRIAEDVCLIAAGCFEDGQTERELMLRTYSYALANNEFFAWEGCIGSGGHAADPDAKPGERIISDTDMVLFDFFPSIDGYYCDITRTFFGKNADRRLKDMYEALSAILETVAGMIQPGLVANDLHEYLRSKIKSIYKEYTYNHHSGHGIGLFQAEKPFIRQGSTDILMENQIIALEPGIYIPGTGGMRLENCYLIEKNGCRKLNKLDDISM